MNDDILISKDEDFQLKANLENKEDVISENDRAKLSLNLLKLDSRAREDIAEISSMLNRKNNDSFYISSALASAYMGRIESSIHPKLEMENFEKNMFLSLASKIIKRNSDNKEFMAQIYNILRKGSNVDVLFNQRKMFMLLSNSTEKQNHIISELNEKAR